MANKKASDLTSLSATSTQPDDLIVVLDINSDGTGRPELKNMTMSEFSSYVGGEVEGNILELNQRFLLVSSSHINLSQSFLTNSSSVSNALFLISASFKSKLDSSLTGSFQCFGLPTLDSNGKIYTASLPPAAVNVSSVFSRTGNITALASDYSSFYLQYSGGSMTGPIILSGLPVNDYEAAPKIYVDNNISSTNSTINNLSGSVILISGSIDSRINGVTGSISQLSSSIANRQTLFESYIPVGGNPGEILVKNSSSDYDYNWSSASFGNFAFYPKLDENGRIKINQGFVNNIEVSGSGPFFSTGWSTGSTSLYWVKVEVNTGSGQVVSASIETGSLLPSNTSTLGYQPVFLISESGSILSQHVRSSLRHEYSASVHYFYSL